MANTIVTPAIRKRYRTLIKQVVKDLHKLVVVHLKPDSLDCPNCFWSVLNQKSSGQLDSSFVTTVTIFGNLISPISFTIGRCQVCFGAGKLISSITRNLKALVKWEDNGEFEITPAGREGHPLVRLKVLRKDYDTIVNAEKIIVDGVTCELIKAPTVRGLGKQEELVVTFCASIEIGFITNK